MYEFKRSLVALLGILTLVGIAIVAFPHNGRSANGPNNNAPTAQTQNVNVVNTPGVSAQQTGPWNVGITGTPTVNAQQTGPWNVGIAGTPTVTLNGTSVVKVSGATDVVADVQATARPGAAAFFGPFDVSAYKQIRIATQPDACSTIEVTVNTEFPGGGNFAILDDAKSDNCLFFTKLYDFPGQSIRVKVDPNIFQDTNIRLVIWGREN
jgi:hypothetical protein